MTDKEILIKVWGRLKDRWMQTEDVGEEDVKEVIDFIEGEWVKQANEEAELEHSRNAASEGPHE
jgi:hypothetical protein